MARGILAVVAGYIVMAIGVVTVTGAVAVLFPTWSSPENAAYVIFNLGFSLVFALAGGYVTAVVAKRAPLRHAIALAALAFILAIISMVVETGPQPRWYQLSLVIIMPPAMVLGGYLRARQVPAA